MPAFEVSEVIPVPARALWEVVDDVESFPRLLPHVRALKVLERGPKFRVTSWEVALKCACVMRWVEREEIDADRFRIDRHAIKGDLTEFSGYWQIEPETDERSRLTLWVHFEIGIPGMTQMADPLAERVLRDNSATTLSLIGKEAVQRQTRAAAEV
jgi:ribosome-associated toxin RatA of RatAB toxin-antitoxin module